MMDVRILKFLLQFGHIVVQLAEFVEVDSSTVIFVEHIHDLLNVFVIDRLTKMVHRFLKFVRFNLAEIIKCVPQWEQ